MIRILISTLLTSLLATVAASGNSVDAPDGNDKASVRPSIPMTAEMAKRSDGSWVITKLSTTDVLVPRNAALKDHPRAQATFEKYRRALTKGNVDKLASVWIMNPAERQEMDRLAQSDKRMSVSITDATIVIDGKRASVSFIQNQRQAATAEKRKRKFSRRGMAAYDSAGAWDNVTTH